MIKVTVIYLDDLLDGAPGVETDTLDYLRGELGGLRISDERQIRFFGFATDTAALKYFERPNNPLGNIM